MIVTGSLNNLVEIFIAKTGVEVTSFVGVRLKGGPSSAWVTPGSVAESRSGHFRENQDRAPS